MIKKDQVESFEISNGAIRVSEPGNASLYIAGASTGAIKIAMPPLKPNTQVDFTITLFNYSGSNRYRNQIKVSGYATSSWQLPDVLNLNSTDKDLTVRFGDDGVNSCVWIGETSSAWNFLSVAVSDFKGSRGNVGSFWSEKGWSISLSTAFGTVNATLDNNFPFADFNKIKNKPTTLAGYGITDGIPKEHQINGTRQTANITGTFNFDWTTGVNGYNQFVLTPTGATTLGNTNLPTGTDTKVKSGIFKASANAVTFPSPAFKAAKGNDPLSATLDTHCTLETYPTYVLYTLTNIPA